MASRFMWLKYSFPSTGFFDSLWKICNMSLEAENEHTIQDHIAIPLGKVEKGLTRIVSFFDKVNNFINDGKISSI